MAERKVEVCEDLKHDTVKVNVDKEKDDTTQQNVKIDTVSQQHNSASTDSGTSPPKNDGNSNTASSVSSVTATKGEDSTDKVNETESKGAIAHMRGKLKMTDEELVVFSGVWAMNKEDFADKTKTGKMHYDTTLTKSQLKAGDLDGTCWDGYFMYKQGSNEDGKPILKKIKEEGIELNLQARETANLHDVTGYGENEFGTFSITGLYDSQKQQMMLTRQYNADDDIEDDRTAEEQAEELRLLRDDLNHDVNDLINGSRSKRKNSGGVGPVSIIKRSRRGSAIRAQNQWRDEIAALTATAGATPRDELQQLASELKAVRKNGTIAQIMPILRKLSKFEITVADLQRTKIGSIVNKIVKKHHDLEVSEAIVDISIFCF